MKQGPLMALILVSVCIAPVPLQADDCDLAANAALQYWQAIVGLSRDYRLSDARKEVLRHPLTAAINDETVHFLRSVGPILEYVHRGAAMKRCEWALPLTSDGPNYVLRHYTPVRSLVNLLCFRARYRFSRKEHEEGVVAEAAAILQGMTMEDLAVDDLSAAMILARHVSSDRTWVSRYGSFVMEERAVQVAARYVPGLDAEALQRFQSRLDKLPPAPTLSQVALEEKEWMLGWLRRIVEERGVEAARNELLDWVAGIDSAEERKALESLIKEATDVGTEDLLALIEDAGSVFDATAELFKVPVSEFDEAVVRFEKEKLANPLARVFRRQHLRIEDLANFRLAEAKAEARLAMLRTAIAIGLEGPGGLAKFNDPFGNGPFEYRPLKSGFELRSKLVIDGERFAIAFGNTEAN